MARPAGIQQRSPHYTRAGVVLALSPSSDPTFRIQVRRALGSSTGTFSNLPDVAGTYGPGMPVTYTDVLPDDGQYRVYQTRSIRDGYGTTGSWGNTLKLKPSVLPDGSIIATPITGNKVSSNLSVSTGQQIQFGSAATPSSYVKMIVAPGGLYTPESTAIKGYTINSLYVQQAALTGTTAGGYYLGVPMPPGATILKFSSTYARATGAKLTMTLQKIKSGAASALVTFTNPSTASQTVTSSSFGPLLAANYDALMVHVVMKSTAAGANARAGLCNITYRVGTYTNTY